MTSPRAIEEPLDLLLIEDNPGDARLFEALLEDAGLDAVVRWERSFEAGLTAAREARPDLLVLDLGLPDSEGLEGVQRVTDEFPDVPVVVLTGRDDPELGQSAVREGAQDYLLKGDVTPGALTHTLRYALLRTRADAEIRRREKRFGAVLSNVSDVISVIAPDGTVLYQSPSLKRVLGYEPEELEGEDILEYFHPEDREYIQGELEELATEPDGGRVGEARFRHADGSWRMLESRGRVPPEDSDNSGIIIVSRDVTERVAREQELERTTASLRESEERFRQMAENIGEVFWLRDPSSEEILYVSPAYEDVWGRPIEELYEDPQRWVRAIHPEDRETIVRVAVKEMSHEFREEYRIVRPDGEIRWIRDQGFPVTDEEGEVYRVAGVARDVTEQKRLEEQLRYRALHDPLTGLANRTLLVDRVEQGLARARRSGQPLGLLMLDVVRFKRINDRLGHATGDRVLEALARRLQEEVRDEDTVARWGGDEFVVVLPELEGPEAIRTVYERIQRAVERPVEAMGESLHLDLFVGGVLYGTNDHPQMVQAGDPEELVRFGDLALHRARERPAANFYLFDPDEEQEGVAHFRREQELRRGLEADEFVPHYQPVVRLSDGELVGFEALARWTHPERGLVSPGEFIPLAEELGLIDDLGEQILERGARQVAGWSRDDGGGSSPTVSFNLSGQQFEDPEVADRLRETVEGAGLSPERVILEVTETVIMQDPARIDELRALGFRVYVDDFGTGYSTFAYLRDLSLDGLKIDMSFVQRMTESRTDAALVETMLTLGETLELTVVAEGVETEEQRARLCEMGCDLGQGYLFARPMPGEDARVLLE